MNTSKFIGSILILVGTAVGAGMLALPMVSAANGFIQAAILLVIIWLLVTLSALLLLEINLAFQPYHNSFSTMAYATLGNVGRVVAWITCLLLLYALASAYIAGNASLLALAFRSIFHISMPLVVYALIFTIVLGGAVFWSTRVVDHVNRGLISLKGFMLVLTVILLMPYINIAKLDVMPTVNKAIFAAAPIFLCSFGFQTVIPSLTNYVGPKPKMLKWIIIIGAIIPLVFYLLWLAVTLGIVPLVGFYSFAVIKKTHGSVGEVVEFVGLIVRSKIVIICVNIFADVAMATSFLGVTLGLFDFIADATKRKNNYFGRLQTALLTFIPPLLFAVYYPRGFVVALGHASVFVAILGIIMPALMVYRLRKSKTLSSPFRVFGGTALLVIIGLSGVALIVIQCQV